MKNSSVVLMSSLVFPGPLSSTNLFGDVGTRRSGTVHVASRHWSSKSGRASLGIYGTKRGHD